MVWRLRLPSGRVAGSELYMLFAVSREPRHAMAAAVALPERRVACLCECGGPELYALFYCESKTSDTL